MIAHLYDDGPDGLGETVGGPLHAVLDDWNLSTDTIEPYYFGDEQPELVAHCDALAAKLTALSVPERYSANAHFDGYARDGVALWSDEHGWPVRPAN